MLRISLLMILVSGCSLFFGEDKKSSDAGTGTTVDASPSEQDAMDGAPGAVDADVGAIDAALSDAATALQCDMRYEPLASAQAGISATISFTDTTGYSFVNMSITYDGNVIVVEGAPEELHDPPKTYTWRFTFQPLAGGIHNAVFSHRQTINGAEAAEGSCMFPVAPE